MGLLVKFSVSPSEKWADVEDFFACYPSALQQLLSAITERDSNFNFETLKVATLIELVSGKRPREIRERYANATVRQWCEMLNSLHDGVARWREFMEATVPPMTLHQRSVLMGIKSNNVEEAVLWTLKECYTLNGLEAAQNLTVYEYCIARKQKYNESVVAYNQASIAGSRR